MTRTKSQAKRAIQTGKDGEGSLTRAWVTKVSEHLGMSADQLMRGGQA